MQHEITYYYLRKRIARVVFIFRIFAKYVEGGFELLWYDVVTLELLYYNKAKQKYLVVMSTYALFRIVHTQ